MHDNSDDIRPFLTHWVAVLLAALFVITALTGLILFNVERRAFDPGAYQDELESQNFYRHLPALLSELLAQDTGGSLPSFLGHLSANQWQLLIQGVLPEQQLRSMTEDTLGQFFAYLNGETDTPRISLLPLKNGLSGPAGLNAVLTLIQSQPDCTVQQILKIISSFGQELCNPPREVLSLLHPVIQLQMQTAASLIPDSVSVLPAPVSAALEPVVKGLKALRLLMRLSPLVPIGILLLLTIIKVRTFKGWSVWWGRPFLLTGLFGMPLGFAGAPLFRWGIERWLSRRITLTFIPEITAALRSLLDATLREILKPAAWGSLALFFVGLVMVLISAYFTSRDIKKRSPSVLHIRVT